VHEREREREREIEDAMVHRHGARVDIEAEGFFKNAR